MTTFSITIPNWICIAIAVYMLTSTVLRLTQLLLTNKTRHYQKQIIDLEQLKEKQS